MSSFLELVNRARGLLADHGRVSVRALGRELAIDDASLDDLTEELVDVQQVATRDGKVLVWAGAAAPALEPGTPSPAGAGVPSGPVAPGADSGERRQLTVMFCDLIGSTEMAQRLDPEDLRALVREYRAICVEAVARFDGHVAQYLGDGVMVYFGWPQAHEDDAGRAIRAGLEIQRGLGERPAGRIAARIGIHTGLVVVDPNGVGDEALALGPTSNLAARIEGMAQPGTVVVSDATLALCRGVFVTRPLGETALKGVDAPVLLHEVERSVGVRTAISSDAARPMVGRERELGHLLDRFEEVEDGRGQVVLVSGEPGMGKSRLLQALREKLAESPHIWLDMQCSPFTSGSAFQPLIDLYQTGLASGAAKSPAEAGQLLVIGLEAMPGLPGEKVIPYLLPLLGLPPSARYPLPQTSAEEQRNRTLAALVQINHTLATERPLLLVAEDLHWSDPSTLEYLGRLVEQTPTARWLLVLTSRPEFRAPWAQSHVSELRLAPLSRRLTRDMITSAAGGRLPEPVLAELEARSDGVPLFVEELVSGVVSSGVVTQHGERYELRGRLEDLAVPATLQDSLMGRLDRLSASKHVAQQAATLGREFSYALIAAVTELDAPALRTALAQLVAAEMVHQRGTPPEATYTFKHALLQDTAYESQLLSTRKALHGKIAAVIEARFSERVEAEPEMMARHWAAAGESSKAVDYYQRAGALAVSRLSNEEAAEHFRRALDALDRLPDDDERRQREIAIRLALGEALMTLHGYRAREVLETFGRVEALCGAIGEGPQQLPALIGLAQFDMARGAAIAVGERAEALLRVAEPLGISEFLVLGHFLAGVASLLGSSTAEGGERLARALEILPTVNFPPPATAYVQDLVTSLHAANMTPLAHAGKFHQLVESMRACRERLSEIDHDFSKAISLALSAYAWMVAEDPETTRSLAEEALTVAGGRGFHSQEAFARITRGWARACQGETDEGVRDVESAFALAETSGSDVLSPGLYIAAADTYRMAGDRERATELLDQATQICERDGLISAPPLITATKARILLELGGDPADAETLFLEALGDADSVGLLWVGLITATRLAHLAPKTGKVREAHDRLAARYASLSEGFERAPAREARAARDELAALLAAEAPAA